MRRLLLLTSLFVITTAGFAKPPVGDWESVQDIPEGWQIIVVTEFTFPCIFAQATEDELTCTSLRHGWAAPHSRQIRVRRDRIREIRVEKREGANMLAGAALGAGTGAGFGAVAAASSKAAPVYLFGTIGALLGSHVGRDTHILRGKVIYRSSPVSAQSNSSDETQESERLDATVRTSR
jgi:hypothetical protein